MCFALGTIMPALHARLRSRSDPFLLAVILVRPYGELAVANVLIACTGAKCSCESTSTKISTSVLQRRHLGQAAGHMQNS